MNRLFRSTIVGLALGVASLAATASEPIRGQLEDVEVAGRRVQVSGVVYDLSSTVRIGWQGGARLSLTELRPGNRVLIQVQEGSDPPVLTELLLIPE